LDNLLDLKKEVAVDNADVASCGFLTNTKVESVLGKLKDSQGQYLLSPYGAELGRSQIAGRRFEVSNNVPSNLTRGSGSDLSAVIYGNFSDLLIGLFGTLEILVDPYTDFAKGTTGVRVLQSIDIAVLKSSELPLIAESYGQVIESANKIKNILGKPIGNTILTGNTDAFWNEHLEKNPNIRIWAEANPTAAEKLKSCTQA
jgi:hypothetical protein